MSAKAPLIIVSGPSGVGKSTVIGRLLAAAHPRLRLSVSATTRPPRPGEVDGLHYHFWPRARFEQELRAGAFLEHAGEYDYQVINDDLETAVADVRAIVQHFYERDSHAG